MMLLKLMALVTAVVHMVSAQDIGGNVLAQGESGNTQSVIITTKTRAFLSCESGDMVVKVNFSDPFRGLMYAHKSRTSPCRIHGTGATYYELRIPLKGCGTWQESPRVFVNNVTIRFHPALELEEDETKTIVCRYPPPLTQPPGTVQVIEPPTRISPTPIPTRVSTAKLSEVEILIIICLLLFLSLLTLGIGIAYFCLKRRNIRLVRKSVSASSPGSQLTRLSSSRLASSSVLATTVRIPRAVPYSAPADHHYEDYRGESSAADTTTTTSGEEASSSGASVEETEPVYRKLGPKSLLSIPKAILRKPTPANRWHRPPAAVHQHQATAVKKRLETEDQTVSAVLGVEEVYWALKEGNDRDSRVTTGSSPPVYAQVDKNRKTAIAKRPGSAQRLVAPPSEERRTSEEVTRKDTTVTTSVRKEVTETRIVSPALDRFRRELEKEEITAEPETEDVSSLVPIDSPPKTVLIRDVSDVFVTTTVETELRELTTTVSRDSVEAHRATKAPPPPPEEEEKAPNWSVVIRQREPPEEGGEPPPDDDDDEGEEDDEGSPEDGEVKPQFDVKIRTRPPSVEQPKSPDPLVVIPPFEMPKTLSTLREALKPKKPECEETTEEGVAEERVPQRTVRWKDDTKEGTSKDTVSSSDSFQSGAESLRERSSSEVLEVAPTLPSQQRRPSNRPMLERSTSEMVPEDHVRWVGGQVPVLESLSPEFLANIPIVIQGGFFNKQRPPTPHEKTDE